MHLTLNHSISPASLAAVQVSGATDEFVRRVRSTSIDDLGQSVVRFTSQNGGEPLRNLLRRARPGEEVILASYSLFEEAGPFREIGPVYISATEGPSPWIGDIFESDYFGAELVLRAYTTQRWIQQAQRLNKDEAPGVIESWLSDHGILFVDARFATFGCFACRFSRI